MNLPECERVKTTTKWDVLLDLNARIEKAAYNAKYAENKISTGQRYLGDVNADFASNQAVLTELKAVYNDVLSVAD